MVPSRELAVQVAAEIVSLAAHNENIVKLCIGDDTTSEQSLACPILIGTPKGLFAAVNGPGQPWSIRRPAELSAAGRQILSSVKYVVLDEASN